jgi:hypothetical protein
VGGPRANVSALTEPEFAGDKKAKREIKRLHNVIDKAQDGLLDVVPTTIAGVAALLDYAAEHAPQGNGGAGALCWTTVHREDGKRSTASRGRSSCTRSSQRRCPPSARAKR